VADDGVKKHADGQMSGLAGEFFVAAELLKRDIQTSVTLGNAKSIDLLAFNHETDRQFAVQVKALRTNNYFLVSRDKILRSAVYVFVLLNRPGQTVRYFIVPAAEMLDHPERFGKGFGDPKLPGILPRDLEPFEDNWKLFTDSE